jgi:hypothetical protein
MNIIFASIPPDCADDLVHHQIDAKAEPKPETMHVPERQWQQVTCGRTIVLGQRATKSRKGIQKAAKAAQMCGDGPRHQPI